MSAAAFNALLGKVMAGGNLTRDEAREAFNQIMDGQWTEAQTAGMLVALAAKGESVEELTGAALAMREHSVKLDTRGIEVLDVVGTGGTGLRTINISTPAALVAAGAGAAVAKHGNRTNTRPSGSADVLEALGVNLDADIGTVARCLAEAGICYLFAIKHHPAMKHAVPVRKQLAVRTIFNILGPLTNPASATRQLMGVFDAAMIEPLARVLAALGVTRAMVVHADDGLDEISTTAPTQAADLAGGKITTRTITGEQFGFAPATLADLAVESAAESAERIRAVLAGHKGPDRDIIVLNAAAALAVAGKADGIAAALPLAAESIDSGKAAAALEKLIEVSNSSHG